MEFIYNIGYRVGMIMLWLRDNPWFVLLTGIVSLILIRIK